MAIDEKKLIEESTWYPDKMFAVSASDHYRNGWNDCNRDWLKRFKELSLENKTSDNYVPDTNVGKWIPFDKQLPPKLEDGIYQGYIVQVINVLEPFTAYWDGEKWLDEWYDKMYGVIAWMPLPEPYKGEEK